MRETRRTLKGTPVELRAMLEAYERAGVHEVVVDPASTDAAEVARTLVRFRHEVAV